MKPFVKGNSLRNGILKPFILPSEVLPEGFVEEFKIEFELKDEALQPSGRIPEREG